jgi:hypothetical protein
LDVVSSPATADGYVIFGGSDGFVYCCNDRTGSLIWSVSTGSDIVSSPVIEQGRVYIVSIDGVVYCLRLDDGQVLWLQPTDGTEMSSPVIVGNAVVVGGGFPNSQVNILDKLTGAVLFSPSTDQMVNGTAAVSGTDIVIGAVGGDLYRIDTTTGGIVWQTTLSGEMNLATPMIDGTSIYVIPGEDSDRLNHVDIDSANWGANNWDVQFTDASAPTGYPTIDTLYAPSSPALSANTGVVVFTVRFDYYIDSDGDFWDDLYILNEYVYGVDPGTQAIIWTVSLGSASYSTYNDIPEYLIAPSPLILSTAGGDVAAIYSSVDSNIRFLDPTDGTVSSTQAVDAPGRSTPVFSNGWLYVGTDNEGIHAFESTVNTAPVAATTGFSPASGEDTATTTPTFSWAGFADAEDASGTIVHTIRIDDDGEVLMDWDDEVTLGAGVTSHSFSSALTKNTSYTYSVRAVDGSGAQSRWSEPITFSVDTIPDEPTNLSALAGNQQVSLTWTASTATDVASHELRWEDETGATVGSVSLGVSTTAYTAVALSNNVEYTFFLKAVDNDSDESAEVSVAATPTFPVQINGANFTSIQAALSAASAGDTVQLSAGEYVITATLVVPEGVSLAGDTARLTILSGDGTLDLVEVQSSGAGTSTISALTLTGGLSGVVNQVRWAQTAFPESEARLPTAAI